MGLGKPHSASGSLAVSALCVCVDKSSHLLVGVL